MGKAAFAGRSNRALRQGDLHGGNKAGVAGDQRGPPIADIRARAGVETHAHRTKLTMTQCEFGSHGSSRFARIRDPLDELFKAWPRRLCGHRRCDGWGSGAYRGGWWDRGGVGYRNGSGSRSGA